MNSVVVVAVLISVLVAMVDLHAVADRAQQSIDVVKPDVMVVLALQPVVAFHAAVVAVEVVAVAIYDFDWQLLVQHFVTMFDLLEFVGNYDAAYRRRVVE